MREGRVKRKTWKDPRTGKVKVKFQVLVPHSKTGKEVSKGVFSTETQAKKHLATCRNKLYTLTDFGKKETRTVAHLLAAFLEDCEDRLRWTIANKAWYEKGRSLRPSTNRGYHAAAKDILRARLGDTQLIALELDDLNHMVKEIEDDVSKSVARRAGESLCTVLRWGAVRGWTIQPMLLGLLGKVRLPPKCKREKIGTEAHYRACLKAVFGPRPHKVERITYLHCRIIWLTLITNGPRRMELAEIRIENIDRLTGRVWIANGIDHATSIEMGVKTRAGHRNIWLPKQAMDDVDYLIEMRGNPTSGRLFEPARGKSIGPGMYATYLLPVLKRAGIPREESKGVINFHSTRHRSTSEHDYRGVSKPARQLLLGHSGGGRDVTDGYTHMLPEDMASQRAVQEIADFYMPDEITPLAEEMKPKVSDNNYHQWDPEKRRAYHREYMRKRRATSRGHMADNSP